MFLQNLWHEMQNFDFRILKWFLIFLAVAVPLFLIYMLISWKLTIFNTWFWEGYWLRLITWEFGAWKTKNVFQSAFLWKKKNPNWILISNMNYDFVDFYFNSKKDFDFLLRDLVKYIHETNNDEDLKKSIDFPPVKIIVDEAHLYLFARDFKWFTKDILLVLTQCRKRDISVDFITQELWQIDVFIRRLCPYIEYFEKLPFGLSRQSILYSLDVEWTSMKNDEMFEVVEACYLLPFSWWPIFNKSVKDYYSQKFLTKKVIWYEDVWYSWEDKEETCSRRYEEFKEKMLKNLEDYRKPKEVKPNKLQLFFHSVDNWFLTHVDKKSSIESEIIKKQSEIIKSLLQYVPENELTKYSSFIEEQKISSESLEIVESKS